jgi:ribonuclease P protein component
MRNSLTHKDFAQKPLKTISGTFFALSVQSAAQNLRFSCVASKKVSLKAVERNRIKRRARPIAAEALAGHPGAFVVSIKKAALDASTGALREDLQKLIMRLKAR